MKISDIFFIFVAFKSLVQENAGTAQNITVFGSSQQSVSFLRMYYQKNVGVFPYLTAVIDVKDGVSFIKSQHLDFCFSLKATAHIYYLCYSIT